ncbi:MAG: NAD(P)H-dependent oxidoreductase [Myxococcales bacterium]|nr:NAD(P)H-dependent oxidoreductase [Myxococcales bacterium]
MRIATVCGSLQTRSRNRALLERAAAVAPAGVEVVADDALAALPLFNPDIEDEGATPAAVARWRRHLSESDAVLIACPEYGHSLPGALKNGIDWVIGSGELNRKVVAITAAVLHPSRGLRGLAALSDTLHAVDAQIVWRDSIVADAGADAALVDLLARLAEAAAEARARAAE